MGGMQDAGGAVACATGAILSTAIATTRELGAGNSVRVKQTGLNMKINMMLGLELDKGTGSTAIFAAPHHHVHSKMKYGQTCSAWTPTAGAPTAPMPTAPGSLIGHVGKRARQEDTDEDRTDDDDSDVSRVSAQKRPKPRQASPLPTLPTTHHTDALNISENLKRLLEDCQFTLDMETILLHCRTLSAEVPSIEVVDAPGGEVLVCECDLNRFLGRPNDRCAACGIWEGEHVVKAIPLEDRQ